MTGAKRRWRRNTGIRLSKFLTTQRTGYVGSVPRERQSASFVKELILSNGILESPFLLILEIIQL
jgi:hypothetical protein